MQIHYEALPAERIEDEMRIFLNFINKNHENTYVKSALAHLWFVIIHPYDDGNGRMARALAHYCLATESIEPFSISSIIYANKKDYYEILEQTTKLENNLNFDFTAWIKWHLEAVSSAIKQAISSLKR
ncbi:MAG: Fic family protein [Campylobacter concisus]|nr:Fic family protein [Campylobacter concisus]